MAKIIEVVEEILKFSPKVLKLNEALNEEPIMEFERVYSVTLPNDYKYLLRRTNGLDLMGNTVYGIHDEPVALSLGGAFKFEHYEVGNEMPRNLIPFSPDGRGNHYCFDCTKCDDESCKIIYWQHDQLYDEDNKPEIVNNSFAEWAKEVLVDWTLEDYDYNGKRKV